MLSKAKLKWVHSLERKKFRNEYGLFLAEGTKLVGDLLPLLSCRCLLATPEWIERQSLPHSVEVLSLSLNELQKLSLQSAPQEVVAVFEIPQPSLDWKIIRSSLSLALDNVQDPGNLGTIIRTADWFGIQHIFCSKGTVDAYHPKSVQASMGAIGRVQIHYTDLVELCQQSELPVFGTFLEGDNIYQSELPSHGIIVMGNEGNGISASLLPHINKKLFIPNYPTDRKGSESLNVSIATAIVCSEFRRREAIQSCLNGVNR